MRKVSPIPLILSIFFGIFALSCGSDAQQLLEEDLKTAVDHYRNDDYNAAISVYEGIIQQGWTNGEIYYNLGNCYYKLGQYGRAILNYERARPLIGNDPDLQVNLKLANFRIYDRIIPLPRIFIIRLVEGIGALLSVRQWALFFLVSEWVLLVCLILLNVVHKPHWRRLFIGCFVVILVFFIFTGGFFAQQKIQKDRSVHAIVLAEKVLVRSAPESGSTELFTLHAGVKIRLLRQVSGWSEIRLADGKRGWIQQTAFEII